MIKHPTLCPLNSHSKVLYNPVNLDGCVLALTKPYIGGNKWIDFSGYGNDGSIYGATKDSDGFLSFDGIDDYVDCGSNTVLNDLHEFTVWGKAWFNDITKEQSIIHAGVTQGDGSTPGFRLNIKNSKLEFGLEPDGDTFSTFFGDTTLQNNILYNLVATYKDEVNGVKLYVNGNLDRYGTKANITTGHLVKYVGGLYYDVWHVDGSIAEIALYNRAWTANEILHIHPY